MMLCLTMIWGAPTWRCTEVIIGMRLKPAHTIAANSR